MFWCTCKSRDRGSVWFNLIGPHDDDPNELQVHWACRKPQRQYFERFTGMKVPKRAKGLLYIHGTRQGTYVMTYYTAVSGERVQAIEMGVPGVVFKMWELLDESMDYIMTLKKDESTAEWMDMKVRARAQAEIISLVMPEFYPTTDDVAREAARRYQDENRITPGLATEEVATRPAVGKAHNLPDTHVEFVKKALADGTMDAAALAGMFNVSVSVINSL